MQGCGWPRRPPAKKLKTSSSHLESPFEEYVGYEVAKTRPRLICPSINYKNCVEKMKSASYTKYISEENSLG